MRKGYKQTEIGVIPDDWDLRSLNTITQIVGGGTPSTLIDEYWNGKIPWIAAGDISNAKGRYVKGTDFHISELGLSNSSTKIMPKDTTIIIARGATVGRMAQLGKDMAFNQTCYCLLPREGLDKNYLYYSMLFSVNSIVALSFGTIFGTITTNSFKDWQIPFPTLAEQEAIAEALSDADALIEAVEQLLTKKRQVKQGAMQRLLRPKEGWEPTNLGSIADPNKRWSFTGGPFGSNLKSSDYTDDGVRIIQLQNIGDGEFKDNYEVFTSPQKADELLSCNIYPGEIILSKMGDPVARACIIPPLHERYLMCSDGIRLSVDQKRFNTYFVYTVINAQDFQTKAENAGTGSTRKRIGLTELRNLELLCPPLPEQTAIAEILSDMDAEISALEGKLVKARQVKAGMMSVLLGGKVRLV